MTADVQIGSRLAQCEQVIKAGLSTFIDVGNALSEIRDGKLYRETHKTFEAYCKDRWQMRRDYANKLISAAGVVQNLDSMESKPESERQVRPLAHLPPEEQREVWKKAVEIGGGKPTAKQVQAAVESRKPESREEFLSKMGVASAPPIPEQEDEDSKTIWSLKFHWGKAKKAEKTAFLSWIRERGEMQN